MTQPFRLAERRHHRSLAAARVRVRRRALRGLRRRHARLGAARQRRPPRRAQLQVSPAARHRHGRRRGAERAGAARRAARAPSPTCARRPSSSTTGSSPTSQNRWPSLRFDVGAVNDVVVALPAGGLLLQDVHVAADAAWWLRYEHVIRARRRHGPRARREPDPDRYEHQYAHCDVLVSAAGPAGLAAARAAARRGARVIVCDENSRIRRQPARRRRHDRRRRRGRLDRRRRRASSPRIPTSRCCRARPPSAATTAISSASSSASPIISRRRRRTRRASACGRSAPARSCSRPARTSAAIAYANNDLPGTMLAGAARTYVKRYAVRPGHARRRVHQQRQRLRDRARAARRRRRDRRDRRCPARAR